MSPPSDPTIGILNEPSSKRKAALAKAAKEHSNGAPKAAQSAQARMDGQTQDKAWDAYKDKAADYAAKAQKWKDAQDKKEVRLNDLVKVHAHKPFDDASAARVSREAAKAVASEKKTLEAKQEAKNVSVQAGQEAEANAQKNFQLAQAALVARGEVNAANLGDRSVRAIGRAVGFQLGTDKATVKRNQEVANQVATARLRGIELTRQSDKIQIGDPATIAGTGAASTIAGGLSAGAGVYSAFSKFEVPLKTSL